MNLTRDGYRYEEIHSASDLDKCLRTGAHIEYSASGPGDEWTKSLAAMGMPVEHDHYNDPIKDGVGIGGWVRVDGNMAASIFTLDKKPFPGEVWRAIFPYVPVTFEA